MEIRWSLLAADDLERICAWIERDNPDAARRIAEIIYKDFPNMGRASRRMSRRRELAFPSLPYIAVYQVKEGAVEISRIFHGRSTGLSCSPAAGDMIDCETGNMVASGRSLQANMGSWRS